jgi:DNA-binding NtrC family response regulator
MTSRTQSRLKDVNAALVAARDPELGAQIFEFLRARAQSVHVATTLSQALVELQVCAFDAAILETSFAEGDELAFMALLGRLPRMPQVVVIGDAPSSLTAFRLAQAGVRALLPKPFEVEELARVWDRIVREPPDLRPFLRASVGRVGLTTMVTLVRSIMLDEALAATGGSRRSASGLLGISRQLLQYTLRAGHS